MLKTRSNEILFNTKISKEDKEKYGEIYTPKILIDRMFSMLSSEVFINPDFKWLDPGSGSGHFSILLYERLMNGLSSIICDELERHNHIIEKMIYMIDIKQANVIKLKEIFGKKANIIEGDFINQEYDDLDRFDFIIGNPPYNANGIKKVPSNQSKNKKHDGDTIWIPFTRKAVTLLREKGKLLFIIPSIWMKPDKAKMYDFFINYKLEKIICLTNTETNQIFAGEAQTPTCCLLLSNNKSDGYVELYDKQQKQYYKYKIKKGRPIPLFGICVLNKIIPYTNRKGYLKVYKTNMPSKSTIISPVWTQECQYPNIKTCLLEGLQPKIIINYTNIPQSYNGIPKLVLAHKMYGFPYLDEAGDFGISNRDNYVIYGYSLEELKKINDFLSTKTALYLFETTRYRMKYLEKYVFEFIPDITKLNIEDNINDDFLVDFFNLDNDDINNINRLHKKEYKFYPTIVNL
tara:strand:- start:2541 stop:3923 length:1383 start_codon:yes stop_codon:yes gene_type:complete